MIRRSAYRSILLAAAFTAVSLLLASTPAQNGKLAPDNPQQQSNAPAASTPLPPTPQSSAPLRSNVTLVPVRVVVRDNTGAAIGHLTRDDFQILEDGKPQSIVHFSVSTAADNWTPPPAPASVPAPTVIPVTAAMSPSFELPSRYIAIVFDDAHLENTDLVRARVAADKFLDAPIPPSTRIALFTTSGLDHVDFTQDAAALRKAIGALIPHPQDVSSDNALGQCPPMDYYEADLIINRNDRSAKDLAQADALICTADQSAQAAYAQMMTTAHQLLAVGESNTQASIHRIDAIIDRISKLPGQRNILLVSPGFLAPMAQTQIDELTDRATRAGIFIHTLDARGLFATSPLPDSNNPGAPGYTNARSAGMASAYRREGAVAQDEVMRSLADGTGGFAFLNDNDLEAGFARTVGHPEVSYLIAFAPVGLKHDGKFHTLKVRLTSKNDYTVEARRGFFAPKSDQTPDDVAREEIEDAAYSQQELGGLPIDLDLRYAFDASGNAKLLATTHVNATGAQFDTRDGQRTYNFTVVTALFDGNGNYLEGNQKAVGLRVKDPSPEKLAQGASVRSAFDVKQGPYFVRLVVRDALGGTLAAKTASVNVTPQLPPAVAATNAPVNFEASTPGRAKKSAKKSSAKPKEPALVWNPPDTDAKNPDVAAAPPCPVSDIIIAAGNRASELSANLERFDAIETTAFESYDRYGVSRLYIAASFDYTVEFDRQPGVFRIQESRTPTRESKAGLSAVQDSGVPAVALIFHPFYRVDFEMHCDGASDWNGQPAWVVRFHQIPGHPSRILQFSTREATYVAKLKGRAWIAQDSGQIVHLETNLEEGIPMMNLVSNSISIDYAPVRFQSQRVELWLPQHATTFTEYTDRRTIMNHVYSDFKLFSVQSNSAILAPKSATTPANNP
ncbi:MAG: VWA domain-containing protein [Candidatus Acidiferrales bacterium]